MELITKFISDLIQKSTRINISKYDKEFLLRLLNKRMLEINSETIVDYSILLAQNKEEQKHLIASLEISYSEFFRSPLTYEYILHNILPMIAQHKKNSGQKEIRIWSAACASGQEAYSLAIILEEFKNLSAEKINFRIFATDQSFAQIEEARKGVYSELSMANVSMKRLNKWFLQNKNTYEVKPQLKENIVFSVFDLFNEDCLCPVESIFGDFDLIICANVLYYFQPTYRGKIIKKLTFCLRENGFIVTSESESGILKGYNMKEIFPQSGIFCVS